MLTAAILAAALANPAFTDPAAIDRAVEAFTGAPAGAEGGAQVPVDRRLRLAACTQPLDVSWFGSTRENVVVECRAGQGWRIFVPVRSASQASNLAAEPAIRRGDPVTISLTGDGFSVSQPGEAMESGPQGAWIRVRSLAGTARPMRARVVRAGLVELPAD